jgi:adenylate cyclase
VILALSGLSPMMLFSLTFVFFFFLVFGDTVNVAARMESTSKKMRIQCTETTFRLLEEAPNLGFNCEACESVVVKGKGRMSTWFINSITDSTETIEMMP